MIQSDSPLSIFNQPSSIIHKGIETRYNNNGFFILRVHYTADPAKDPATPEGKKWYEQARRGMPETSWMKEYEIDWFARSGQLVYPMFDRNIHIVEPFIVPKEWNRYMAIDPGLRNPTAALWAAVDRENNVFLYDEYYICEKTIREHCRAIKVKEGANTDVIRLIDPSSAGRNMINRQSARDEFARFGVFCRPADNDLEVGVDRVASYLNPDPATDQPRLYFFSTLVNSIREITNYRWEEMDTERSGRNDPPEKPVKRNDHLMDCLRYILMDNPHFARKYNPPRYKPHNPGTGY